MWDTPTSAGDTVVTFTVTGANSAVETADITVTVTAPAVPETPEAPVLSSVNATTLRVELGPVPTSALPVTSLTFQVTASTDTGFASPIYTGAVDPDALAIEIDGIEAGGTFIARQTAVSAAGASTESAASAAVTVTGTVPLWPEGTSEFLPFTPSGNGNPRTPGLFSVSISGTPTITPQDTYRNTTPALVTTTTAFHMPEERGIAVAAGNALEYLIVAKQPAASPAPTMSIKVRDGATATETLITYTWATDSFTSNNSNVIASRAMTTSAGPDGTTRILITGDIIATTANLILGRGPRSSTSEGVLIYAVAHRVAPGAPPSPIIVPDEYIYVAKPGTAGAGTPNNANGRRATLALAKANPMASIVAAVGKAAPGTLILVGNGVYQDGRVLFNANNSGTATKPVWLVSETDRGARISGPTNLSTLEFSTASHIKVYNFEIENRSNSSADNACAKVVNSTTNGVTPINNIEVYGCRLYGGGRDGIKVAASRGVVFKGCRIENGGGSGSASFAQSAVDFVTALFHDVQYCTIRGTWKEGYVPKAGSTGTFSHNDVEVLRKGTDNTVAVMLGELGESRTGRVMPWAAGPGNNPPAYPWKWAEAQDIVVSNNRLKTNFTTCIWLRGAVSCSITGNWLDAGSGLVTMLAAPSGLWSDQPTTVPAPHTAFATVSGSTITYDNRLHTITGNWRRTGLAATVTINANQNNSHTIQSTFTEAATAASVLTGTVGEDGWDRTAIYTALGI